MRLHLLLTTVVSAVSASKIVFFAQNLETQNNVQLGSLEYDQQSSTSAFSPENHPTEAGSYCIGTKDLPGKECFAYLETTGDITGQFVIYVDNKNELTEVSFLRGANVLDSRVERIKTNVVPNLNPSQGQPIKEPVVQKVSRKVVVQNEDGEDVEIVEEVEEVVPVDDRSWIQKNWMYIVLPLVLVLLVAPEEKPEGN